MSKLTMDRIGTVCIIVDIQEKLLPPMWNKDEMVENCAKAIKGLIALEIPMIVSEQYPQGLGRTIPEIAAAVGDYTPLEKTTFSCMRTPSFKEALKDNDADTVILIGMEAHVCVMQTAFDLLEDGYNVFLLSDCVASRSKNDMDAGLERMARAGVTLTTYEAAFFELMDGSKSPGFKEIQEIIK